MSNGLWNKKLPCPFCGSNFETTRMRASAIRIKERQSDFGSIFDGTCPYRYAVTVCPNCSIAARNEEFETFMPEYEPRLLELSRRMRGNVSKHDALQVGELSAEHAIKRHEIAISMHRYRSHSDSGEMAGLWMHVVWIWREVGELQEEMKAMESAVQAYLEFFEKGTKFPEKLGEPGVLYLIGELYRRMGHVPEARNYFSKALASRDLQAFPNIESTVREAMLNSKDPKKS